MKTGLKGTQCHHNFAESMCGFMTVTRVFPHLCFLFPSVLGVMVKLGCTERSEQWQVSSTMSGLTGMETSIRAERAGMK